MCDMNDNILTHPAVKRHAIDPAAIGAAPRMNSVLQRQYDNEIDALIDQPIAFAQGIYKDNTNIMKKEEVGPKPSLLLSTLLM